MHLTAHHVGIIVSNLDKSKAFYAALGFQIVSEVSDGTKTICFLRLGGFNLELFAYDEPVPQAPVAEGRALGFRHFALQTSDLDTTLTELKGLNLVPADATVREVPDIAKLFFFEDPDGIEIEIMQEL